jgi:NitT/TauT family transport system permease protein
MNKYAFIGPVLLIAIWTIIVWTRIIDPFFLPDPFMVARKLFELMVSGAIAVDLEATMIRVAASFLVAAGIGIPVGLMLGMSKRAYQSTEPVIDFFRSTPASALFPLFLLVFGITDSTKIATAAFAASLVIIFNTAHGVMHAKKSRMLAARIMGATRAQIFRTVIVWESLPQTFVGLRIAMSYSIIIIVLTEMFIGTTVGLGRRIIDAQITYEISAMYAAIILTGIMGYAFNLLFALAEKRFLHWSGR